MTAAEYQYLKILQYIEFLASQRGRGFFLIWIGILLFEPKKQVDLWSSLTLTLVGIFNIILSCMKDKPADAEKEEESYPANQKHYQYQSLLDDVESEPMLEKDDLINQE